MSIPVVDAPPAAVVVAADVPVAVVVDAGVTPSVVVTDVGAQGPPGPAGPPGPYPANALIVARHTTNATLPRPTGQFVMWIGSATPANALDGDLWVNTT